MSTIHNNVNTQVNNQYAAKTAYEDIKNTGNSKAADTASAVSGDISDIVELSGNSAGSANKTYTRDSVRANELQAITQQNLVNLQNMVSKLLNNQNKVGQGLSNTTETFFSFKLDASFEIDGQKVDFWMQYESYSFTSTNGNGMVNIDQATRDEAASLISEDGPLGIKAVSQNILDFAKAISGGDTSKIEMLKNAFIKGFDQIAAMFGGRDKMPEISQKTYDAVMEGFDEWAGVNAEDAE
jgi:hypothetical protein